MTRSAGASDPADPCRRPGTRAGGVVGQAYQAGVLSALQRETAGTRVRPPSLSAPQPARSPERRCAWEFRHRPGRSLYGVPTSRSGGAILRRILPADVEPLRPVVRLMFRPWNLPSTRSSRGRSGGLGLPADVAAMTLLPRGDRYFRAAQGLDEHMGGRWPVVCVSARSAARTGPGRLRPRRRAGGAPRRRSAGLVRHPGYFSRSTSAAPSTSTVACTRPRTPTCCDPNGSTSLS